MSNILLLDNFPYPFEETCFVTGHRPQAIGTGWDDHEAHEICKHALKRLIQKAIQRGYKYLISGMAVGTDLWAAEMVIKDPDLKPMKLIAAVPFPGQEMLWGRETIELYRNILLEAEDSFIISLERPLSRDNLSQKQWASIMLLRRNEWMVDHASLGIGIYDGKQSGGTFRAVEYALKQKRVVCTYNPITQEYILNSLQLSLI